MNPFKTFEHILLERISKESIQQLKNLWADPKRVYHNINHLTQILQDIESNIYFKELAVYEKRILLLAAFFHDAYYDPQKKDNEDKSIEFFKQAYQHNDIVKSKVIRLIHCTKHRKRPTEKLEKIFWDANNSILTQNYSKLIEYEKKIRKEFSFIPESKYKLKRIEFLKNNFKLFNSSTDDNLKKLINYIEKTYK